MVFEEMLFKERLKKGIAIVSDHPIRSLFVVMAFICLVAGIMGCKNPDVSLGEFDKPPVITMGKDDVRLALGQDMVASSTWVVPSVRVEKEEALIIGSRVFKETHGPFLLDVDVNAKDMTFFWVDPDGTKTKLKVIQAE